MTYYQENRERIRAKQQARLNSSPEAHLAQILRVAKLRAAGNVPFSITAADLEGYLA